MSALFLNHLGRNRVFKLEPFSSGEDGDVRVWDIKSREMVSHLKEHNAAVTWIEIMDDDSHAVPSCHSSRFQDNSFQAM